MTEQPPDLADEEIGERIRCDLQRVIHVRRPPRWALVAQPSFWKRCRLATPDWRNGIDHIFVDGFVGACYWNSLKVFDDALEDGLSLWCGFALWHGEWYGHAWCMLRNRVVESTAAFRAYYGAEVTGDELEHLRKQHQKHDLLARDKLHVMTMLDGYRQRVGYDADEYAHTIGRERDPKTREVKPGLGR